MTRAKACYAIKKETFWLSTESAVYQHAVRFAVGIGPGMPEQGGPRNC